MCKTYTELTARTSIVAVRTRQSRRRPCPAGPHILAVAVGLAARRRACRRRPRRDALQGEQWAVAPGTVFDLPGAWELSQGAGVIVAVVDSGMQLDHPDLAPNVWTNFGEIPGNGIDDDGNGYVDDVHGVDLTTRRASQDLHDGFGHGTHVAGTIAAAANGRGVVGVAFRAKMMTVKVLDDNGARDHGRGRRGHPLRRGQRRADHQPQPRGDTDDPRMRAAVQAAAAANVLIVCSAGNSGINVDHTPVFPASIAAPNVVGVAATEPGDGRDLADFSNYGKLTVPVAAPGVDVLSTSQRPAATSQVRARRWPRPTSAGVAALMAAVRPTCPPPSCARCCCRTPPARTCRSAPATSTRSAPCSPPARPSSYRQQAQRATSCASCGRRGASAARPPSSRSPAPADAIARSTSSSTDAGVASMRGGRSTC